MFSEKANNNADACRFCWMCRHVCPVGLTTGKEVNNARAKGLLLSMINRGTEFDSSIAEAMWECVLCGSCSNDCKTGYEPPVFIREARTMAIVENLAPVKVQKLYDIILATGNIYGTVSEHKFDAIKEDLTDLPEQADIILYIGEVASLKTPGMVKAVIGLLKKAGIDFTVLANEPSSGAYLGDLVGFVEDVRRQGQILSHAINEKCAKTVIVLDPLDARIMKHEYPEWNISPKSQIRTITSFIAELIEKGSLKPSKISKVVTFHDAGALSRDLDETQPARNILTAMGITIKEMFLNRDLAKSSGGALFPLYAPELAAMLVKACWSDAKETKVKTLVTEAPGSYTALSDCIPEEMQLDDLFTLLASTCNLQDS
jgi:Fe-S oxidoreductase